MGTNRTAILNQTGIFAGWVQALPRLLYSRVLGIHKCLRNAKMAMIKDTTVIHRDANEMARLVAGPISSTDSFI